MKESPSCARWQRLLATLWNEKPLSSAEQVALKTHIVECGKCAQLYERRQSMLSTLRNRAIVAPLPQSVAQQIRLKATRRRDSLLLNQEAIQHEEQKEFVALPSSRWSRQERNVQRTISPPRKAAFVSTSSGATLITSAPVSTVEGLAFDTAYLRLKRVLDIMFTLLISIPILLISSVIAMLILLDSKGPVIFRQKRIGQNGEEFEMLKFRSMYVNNDNTYHRTAIAHYMNGKALNDERDSRYKTHDDPRITRIGKFLRRTSLDELPQFFNVLCGEMSLVGPRPPLPYEVESYSAYDRLRLCGKPGLTGLWQVYGRSRVPFREMVEMDIAYLQQQSLWQDIKLILLTVPLMLHGQNGA